MAESRTRRAGRPPKVSAAAILDAASAVPASELTLTAIAANLGVSVKTIYYYFPNRTALIRELTTRAVSEYDPPDLSGSDDWREVLRRVGHWTFRTLGELPERGVDAGVAAAALGRVTNPCLETLRRAGFADRDAMAALILVANYASSMATRTARVVEMGGLDADTVGRHLRDLDDAEAVRTFAGLLAQRSMDEWFDAALEIALTGIEVTLGPENTTKTD